MITLFFLNERKRDSCTHSHTSLCRYRKVPSDKCEGGFSPQLAVQTVIRPCGVKPSPGQPARSSTPVTHFDTPVSRSVALISACVCTFNCSCLVFRNITTVACVSQRERLVLILVCAGAGVVVLVAIVSATLAVRRVVYRNRWAGHTSVLHVRRHAPAISWLLWFRVALYRAPVYRFSNLQIQDDDNGITADLESATSSNGTACQQDSDDVGVI